MKKVADIRVFLSSTSQDLREERDAVRDSLMRMGLGFVGMEVFGSSPTQPLDECLTHVAKADIFVMIVAHRYGAITENGMSYTESEYQAACARKIPCFVYLKDEQTPVLPSYVEQEQRAREKLRDLKDKLKTRHVVSWFSTPEDLASVVVADIHKHIVDTYLGKESSSRAAVSLSDIIPPGLLELVLEGLSQRFRIPIGIYAPEGEDGFYSYPEHLHFASYCRILRSNPKGLDICRNADMRIAKECLRTGREQRYVCHAGLTDFAIPVRLGNETLAVLFCGQIRLDHNEEEMENEVEKFAATIGENPKLLVEEYLKMPIHRMSDLEPLIAKLQEVAAYFCKLAREKSVYATEVSAAFRVVPGREDSYAWEMLTAKELIAKLCKLTEEEFTLRLVVPCLERAGFVNVRYCHGFAELGCDLKYEYCTPMGELLHYGAQVKMSRIHAGAGKPGSVAEIIHQGQTALACHHYNEFFGKDCTIDQFWIISPHDLTEEARRQVRDRIKGDLGQMVHFLVGQVLLDKLKRFVPVLLDRLVRMPDQAPKTISKRLDDEGQP